MAGIRFNITPLKKRIERISKELRADAFKPVMERLAYRVLDKCAATTPVRSVSLITANQQREYEHRINYIPSFHDETDPCLRVRDDKHWVLSGGNWYLANLRRIPDSVQSDYQTLLAERERRMQTTRQTFISQRAQARLLYRKSWGQCAQSLRVPHKWSNQVSRSETRRKPKVNPPRGYGQWRGGKHTLTATIYNPFLEQPSRYITFSSRVILANAKAACSTNFKRDIERHFRNRLTATQ